MDRSGPLSTVERKRTALKLAAVPSEVAISWRPGRSAAGEFCKDMIPPLFSTQSHGSVTECLGSGQISDGSRTLPRVMFGVSVFGFSGAKTAAVCPGNRVELAGIWGLARFGGFFRENLRKGVYE